MRPAPPVVDAVFDEDDYVVYQIDSGQYNVQFTDWYVEDGSCTITWQYLTRETVAGQETSNLSLVSPTATSLFVGV